MLKRMLDNVFAVFVIIIVLALIIPLNKTLVDFLIATNIALAIIILLITLYIKEALEFSIFPSILLITTVFRLALSISTTRLILSSTGGAEVTAAAGNIIQAIGNFVMMDNPGVGFIIFVILVLVNFLVITKGAERVSEVAARFTLDAMPGKQMAIDADLAAGAIDDEEAKERRIKVQREADFFGAMDGAVKFVKGDAIMAIVTMIITLVGGMAFGLAGGMELDEVLGSYSLATIGDGLSSQIPALLIAFATGMVVTRTASTGSFGIELRTQFGQNPTVMFIAGMVAYAFMFIPGFPLMVFFVIGSVLLTLGFYLRRQKLALAAITEQEEQMQAQIEQEQAAAETAGSEEYYRDIDNVFKLLSVDQIEMEFGYSLLHLVDEKSGGSFIERLVIFRKDFAMTMGMVFPSVRMRNNPEINPNQYVIKIKGEEVARGEILADHYLALDNGDVTTPVDGIDTIEPAFGIPARWISEDKKVMADVAGYTLIDPVSVMITHLSEIIKQHCHEILSRQDVKTMIDNMRQTNPSVIEDLIPNMVSVGYLQRVLSMLLKEGIPIRDMETILETLSENVSALKDMDIIVEYVRQALKRTVTRRFAEANALRVITLDPRIEDSIISNVKKTDRGSVYVPDPDAAQTIIAKTTEEVEKVKDVLPSVIVLTSPIVRVYFKRLIDQYIPGLTVLSYNEIDNTTQIQAVGNITM
ncbi:MAG: flagellar biosynthesis protein FlhA [Oscillospiraceae bacterium]|jgi:flagellar biosynthesis protein FlhA|nr:flagellar biosynthesis protein FlhA [Oscillospiraceae bacterium]